MELHVGGKSKTDAASKSKIIRDMHKNTKQSTNKGSGNDIIEVNISELVDNKYQPRLSMDSDKLLELAATIQKDGLIQPIGIIPLEHGYMIEHGHRRVGASKLLGLTKIKAIINRDSSDKKLRTRALIENIQRDSMHPLEISISLNAALKNKEYRSQDEIVESLGKDKTWVSKNINLLQLPEVVQEDLLINKSIRDMETLNMIRLIKDQDTVIEIYFWYIKNNKSRKDLKARLSQIKGEEIINSSYQLKKSNNSFVITIDRKKIPKEKEEEVLKLLEEVEKILL